MRIDWSTAEYIIDHGGYAALQIEIEDRTARIYRDGQKLRAHGLIFLGAQFEDIAPKAIVLSDIRQGRLEPQEYCGFCHDKCLLKIYDKFAKAVDSGIFQPGPVDVPR